MMKFTKLLNFLGTVIIIIAIDHIAEAEYISAGLMILLYILLVFLFSNIKDWIHGLWNLIKK